MKTILFDLDGTLLPMDQEQFVKAYFHLLAKRMAPLGFEPQSLIQSVWEGTMAMIQNDGSRTNEAVFWDVFSKMHGEAALQHKSVVDGFYSEEFEQVKDVCGYTAQAACLIADLKAAGYQLVLATNPIFPAVGTRARIGWAGLSTEDFSLITTYENASFCKPNPQYYTEILRAIDCRPEDCLMVGNDVTEDMVAATLGMKVFLLTDCLINKNGQDISKYPHGGFADLRAYIATLQAGNL